MSLDKPYKDIPGTTLCDADMSRQGFTMCRQATAPSAI